MKRVLQSLATLLLLIPLVGSPAFAQDENPAEEIETEKRAQSGFKFLSTSLDARAAAMGDALTAIDHQSSVAMFYNPASMARLDGLAHVALGQTQWIADISYNMISAAFRPANGRFGVFGLSLMAVDYGEFKGTVLDGSATDGYRDFDEAGLSDPSPTALAIGLGYARALTDRFSVGAHVKYAQQDLGDAPISGGDGGVQARSFDQNTVAVDFGVLYKTGFRSLNFAMSARNFSREIKYVQDNFELPLTFRIGVSMDLMDLSAMSGGPHAFLLVVDAERPRDFSEQIRLGGEYQFLDILALRAGYAFPTDEQGVSLGAGLNPEFRNLRVGIDYAFTSFGVFDAVHRFGVQLGF